MWKLRKILDDSIQQRNLKKGPLMTFVSFPESVYYTVQQVALVFPYTLGKMEY